MYMPLSWPSPHRKPIAYWPTPQISCRVSSWSRVASTTISERFFPVRGLACVVSPRFSLQAAHGQLRRSCSEDRGVVAPSCHAIVSPFVSLRLISVGRHWFIQPPSYVGRRERSSLDALRYPGYSTNRAMKEPSIAKEVRSSTELAAGRGARIEKVCLKEGLTEVPRSILECAPRVRLLDLSGNLLTALPDWLPELTELEVLFLSYNRFSHVPEILGKMSRLRMIGMRGNQIEKLSGAALPSPLIWLTLTDNFLRTVPPELGRMPGLQKLLLAGNRLERLPETFREAGALELIRLSANRFESFPEWLFQLPSLAWAAVAGNPCTKGGCGEGALNQAVSWNSIILGEKLGEGASGETFRATVRNDDGSSEDVAVKVFARAISSDGDAADEIRAAVSAGRHPCLVSTRAALTDHPEGRGGLVLDLVPSAFKPLARPPSFDSCTRDVYSQEERFSSAQIVSIGRDVAQGASHLHQCGLVHGDLYAHNTLVSGNRALVSDFGAACFYRGNKAINERLVERVEVRAFGILLEELVMRALPDGLSSNLQALRELVTRCTSPDVMQRPCFEEVCMCLKSL